MARGLSRCRNVLKLVLISCLIALGATDNSAFPRFDSLQLTKTSYHSLHDDSRTRVLLAEVQGHNLFYQMPVRTTRSRGLRNDLCLEDLTAPTVHVLDANFVGTNALFAMDLRSSEYRGPVYFCLPRETVGDELIKSNLGVSEWVHQGDDVVIELPATLGDSIPASHNQKNRAEAAPRRPLRQTSNKVNSSSPPTGEDMQLEPVPPRVTGLRVEPVRKDAYYSDGIPVLLVDFDYQLVLFGQHFTSSMIVTFTKHQATYGGACQYPVTPEYPVVLFDDTVAVIQLRLPISEWSENFYICIKEPEPPSNSTSAKAQSELSASQARPFVHQGSGMWTSMRSVQKLIPLWLAIMIISICLCFSALFSGLNLGLMSLDRTELRILCNTGTAKERMYAKIIQPVRNHGNYLLCSILLGNVLVNSTFTILLDDLTSGIVAIMSSTLLIVLFGEITPQAVCSRYGLAIGARTIVLTKLVMGLTFPLSYPISKFLDMLLGEEIGAVYNRERLKELVKVTTGENDLDKDEVKIISGALDLNKKCVSDIMTHIEDAFLLDYETTLDFEMVSEIMKSGYSRIPVFEGQRNNIVTTLYIKDLAFVDPDDNTPLKTLCQFYQNPCNFVFEDVTLDVMFTDFKGGNKGHMAFVNRVNNEGEGDPFYETIGLVTLEDVIEELIQAEIMDETDVFTDNRSKRRRNADRTKQDFTVFAERRNENNRIRISPQLTLAAFQYLSTSVDNFKPEHISETILRRLLKQDIIHHIKKNKDWRNDPINVIFQQNKPADYFVLILEGRVEVTVGNENLMFEGGAFTYFGTQALQPNIGVVASPDQSQSLQMVPSMQFSQLPTTTTTTPLSQQQPPLSQSTVIPATISQSTIQSAVVTHPPERVAIGSISGTSQTQQLPPSAMGSLQSLHMESMLKGTFQPDYTVRATTEVLYLKVSRSLYLAAKRASLMERSRLDANAMGVGGSGTGDSGTDDAGIDQFDDEVEKLLHSLEEDGSIGKASPSMPRKQSQLNNNNNFEAVRPIENNKNVTTVQIEPVTTTTAATVPTPQHRKSMPNVTSTTTGSLLSGNVGPVKRFTAFPADSSPSANGSVRKAPLAVDGDEETSSQEEASLLPRGSAGHTDGTS